MSAGTIRLSERSKQLYAKRRNDQPRLQDVRMPHGCSVRAFMRPRRRTPPAGIQSTAQES